MLESDDNELENGDDAEKNNKNNKNNFLLTRMPEMPSYQKQIML